MCYVVASSPRVALFLTSFSDMYTFSLIFPFSGKMFWYFNLRFTVCLISFYITLTVLLHFSFVIGHFSGVPVVPVHKKSSLGILRNS